MVATIILLILAGIAKAVMDTLKSRWSVSIFARFTGSGTSIATALLKWLGPDSWRNKNLPKNDFLRLLTRGPLVFLMDGWHFSQFIFLTCIQSAIIIHLPDLFAHAGLSFLSYLMLAKVIMGVPFELFWSHILVSDPEMKYHKTYSLAPEDKFSFWDYYRAAPKIVSRIITIVYFAVLLGAYAMGAPVWMVVVGVFVFFLLIIYLFQKSRL